MSGLQVPGRMSFNVQTVNTPNAQPGIVTVPTPAGLQVFVVGGLTKLEHMAVELAKTDRTNGLSPADIVEMAKQLIIACNEAENPTPAEEPEAEAEQASPILTH